VAMTRHPTATQAACTTTTSRIAAPGRGRTEFMVFCLPLPRTQPVLRPISSSFACGYGEPGSLTTPRGCMTQSTTSLRVTLLCLAMTSALLACASSESEERSTGESRPNLVVVVLDDLDETGGPYWDAMPETWQLIADRGVQFTNAFATDPVCCPARATILSGQYPHNNGVITATDTSVSPGGEGTDAASRSGIEIFSDGAEKRSIAVRLRNTGYRTAFLGKYLNGYELAPDYVPPGWDEWFGLGGTFADGYSYTANHNGVIERYGSTEGDYQTDVLSRMATEFVDDSEIDDGDPMLLTIWPSAPHSPIRPAPRHQGNEFADDDLPTRPNYDEEDVSDKPSWLREGVPRLNEQEVQRQTSWYRNGMGSLLAVDEMIGDLADRLRDNDEIDNTVFMFTSDNGLNRGSHRLPHKMAPYEESIRVPLAIAGPNIRQGTETRFATHVDFPPTLFDLAGEELPNDLDGRSLVPLLRGTETRWRHDFLVEFDGLYSTFVRIDSAADVDGYLARQGMVPYVPTYRALRNEDFLYVEWYTGDVHEYELYDLDNDPYQMRNLLATPGFAAENAAVAATLQARLEELAVCAGASCR
jgi:N-acetylglucosamine-6-sulfatase